MCGGGKLLRSRVPACRRRRRRASEVLRLRGSVRARLDRLEGDDQNEEREEGHSVHEEAVARAAHKVADVALDGFVRVVQIRVARDAKGVHSTEKAVGERSTTRDGSSAPYCDSSAHCIGRRDDLARLDRGQAGVEARGSAPLIALHPLLPKILPLFPEIVEGSRPSPHLCERQTVKASGAAAGRERDWSERA